MGIELQAGAQYALKDFRLIICVSVAIRALLKQADVLKAPCSSGQLVQEHSVVLLLWRTVLSVSSCLLCRFCCALIGQKVSSYVEKCPKQAEV